MTPAAAFVTNGVGSPFRSATGPAGGGDISIRRQHNRFPAQRTPGPIPDLVETGSKGL